MRYNYTVLLAPIIFILLFCQCTEKGSVPGYIYIDQIQVEGENNMGVYDAWIYVNDNLLGVFELPAEVPVLDEGEVKISVGAGIKVNGLSGNRTRYPFYNFYTATRDIEQTQTIQLSPSVSYTSWSQFLMREDFEDDNLNLEFIESDESVFDTCLYIINSDKVSGAHAGIFYLDESRHKDTCYISFKTKNYFTRPAVNNTVGTFLELNYRGSEYLLIGLYVNYMNNVENIDIVYVTPSKQWKKIYVDIGSQISRYTEGTAYQIYFASSLAKDSVSTFGIIDDIRLVQKDAK